MSDFIHFKPDKDSSECLINLNQIQYVHLSNESHLRIVFGDQCWTECTDPGIAAEFFAKLLSTVHIVQTRTLTDDGA